MSTETKTVPTAYMTLERRTLRNEDWRKGKSLAERNRYMLENGVSSDVEFIVGNEEQNSESIPAHTYMLMTSSSEFSDILKHGRKMDAISVPDVNPAAFRLMLEYIYCDRVTLDIQSVSTVLYAAKKFNVHGLVKICINYMLRNISESTVCLFLEYAHTFNLVDVSEKCLDFIDQHASKIMKRERFSHLCKQCLGSIISRDSLAAREEDIFDAVMWWAWTACKKSRLPETGDNARKVLEDVFHLIRFPLMNAPFFTNNVAHVDVLTDTEKVDLFKYFYGSPKPKLTFSDKPRQYIPKSPNGLEIRPYPEILLSQFSPPVTPQISPPMSPPSSVTNSFDNW